MDLLSGSEREEIIHRRSWRRDETRRSLTQEEASKILHLLNWLFILKKEEERFETILTNTNN